METRGGRGHGDLVWGIEATPRLPGAGRLRHRRLRGAADHRAPASSLGPQRRPAATAGGVVPPGWGSRVCVLRRALTVARRGRDRLRGEPRRACARPRRLPPRCADLRRRISEEPSLLSRGRARLLGRDGPGAGRWEADALLHTLYSFPAPRVAHGCLLEAVALALEGRIEPYSQGRGHITPERIDEMWRIAGRHGISLAPLFGAAGLWSESGRRPFDRCLASATDPRSSMNGPADPRPGW